MCMSFSFFKKKYFWLNHTACGVLVSQPGIEPAPPALEAQSLNRTGPRGELLSSQFVLTLVFFAGDSEGKAPACKVGDLG